MQLRTIAAFLVLTLAPALTVAAPSQPPAPILKLVSAFLHATNTDDASALAGLFTDDAVVVDEIPPFVWRGAGAGTAWWNAVHAMMQKASITNLKATSVGLGEFKQSPTDAYLVTAMKITGIADGKPFAESGTQTYTFHNAGGSWLISTATWSTKP